MMKWVLSLPMNSIRKKARIIPTLALLNPRPVAQIQELFYTY
jgi:hypothetical protein